MTTRPASPPLAGAAASLALYILLAGLVLPVGGARAQSVPPPLSCNEVSHGDELFAVCTVRAGADLRLFLNDAEGRPYGSFARLATALEAEGGRLGFAMNAGMYHPDRRPVGLYIEEGRQQKRLVTSAGPGNFGMLPNGLFCILAQGFAVIETRRYAARPADCLYASQSGPMLVIDAAIHPRFLPASDSRHVRNGVGVSADGRTAHFVISSRPVTFDAFARLFAEALAVPQALYFDGKVSRLFAPDLGRIDGGLPMGPIVGLVLPAR